MRKNNTISEEENNRKKRELEIKNKLKKINEKNNEIKNDFIFIYNFIIEEIIIKIYYIYIFPIFYIFFDSIFI